MCERETDRERGFFCVKKKAQIGLAGGKTTKNQCERQRERERERTKKKTTRTMTKHQQNTTVREKECVCERECVNESRYRGTHNEGKRGSKEGQNFFEKNYFPQKNTV